jgi:hypothetical protein
LENEDIEESIMLRWIFRKWDGGSKDWIDVVQDRTSGGLL